MVTKKKIIENELMKEIVSIRVDALWKMLSQKKDGLFPEPYEEGATGKFDNKGAIFIPGGLIYKDVDEMPIAVMTSAIKYYATLTLRQVHFNTGEIPGHA